MKLLFLYYINLYVKMFFKAKEMDIKKIKMDEVTFRWLLNEDAMATEKLSEGIRRFAVDFRKLEALVQNLLK